MAAYCECCGAEITLKAEACPVCKTPRHGMARAPDSLAPADPEVVWENAVTGFEFAGTTPRPRACCIRS